MREFLALTLVVSSVAFAQTTARVDSFYAPSIRSMVRYSYLLPEQYDSTDSYPILYLLHGYSGDHRNWVELTNLPTYGPQLGVIVIMPDAGNSWYVNSPKGPDNNFEDLIIKDLRGRVEQRYAADTSRRAIAGLSMGGYGAIMLGLRHPNLFRFAASLSGALSIPGRVEFPEKNTAERALLNLKEVFGTDTSFHRSHDPLHLYRTAAAKSLPYLYIVMGTNDGFATFLPAHRILTDSLRLYGARYEYHETQGGHSWKFWGREIRPLLTRMMEVLNERSRK